MHRITTWIVSATAGICFIASCSSERGSMTGTSPLVESARDAAPGSTIPSATTLAGGSSSTRTAGTPSNLPPEGEEFNCTNVQSVHARFSHPGFVRDNAVGFFVSFLGVPDETLTLRLWWDYEGAPGDFEDVPFEDGDVFRGEGDLLNVETTVEHTYGGLKGETVRRVRVELIVDDKTGNCARVRDVAVRPPAPTPSASGCPGGLLSHDNGAGTGTRYCYAAGDSIQVRAEKACESHFGAGNCCVITGGYQDMQYGQCGAGGGGGSIHWHWDNHPAGHCGPIYVVGDVVSPGWCGTILGSFTN